MTTQNWSKTWTFFANDWHEGNVPIIGVRSHAAWMCSTVFDGARAFEGVTPDIELHCARVNDSAAKLFLKPLVSVDTWIGLARDAIARFDGNEALYIRPMYWAEREGPRVQPADFAATAATASVQAPFRVSAVSRLDSSPSKRPPNSS